MTDALSALGGLGVQNAMTSSSLNAARNVKNKGGLESAAQEFEAMFMGQLLQPMFSEIETDSMFGGGHGEAMMRGFLIQEYWNVMAKAGLGNLSDSIKGELIRLQNQTAASGKA